MITAAGSAQRGAIHGAIVVVAALFALTQTTLRLIGKAGVTGSADWSRRRTARAITAAGIACRSTRAVTTLLLTSSTRVEAAAVHADCDEKT